MECKTAISPQMLSTKTVIWAGGATVYEWTLESHYYRRRIPTPLGGAGYEIRASSPKLTLLVIATRRAFGEDLVEAARRRIIKGRPFEVDFECEAKLYRKEHPYGH
jgi:hypothetical protein